MKFDCGLTPLEKHNIKILERKKMIKEQMEWHDYFAWLPVQIASRDCRWLETIEVRFVPYKEAGVSVEEAIDFITSSNITELSFHGRFEYRAKQ